MPRLALQVFVGWRYSNACPISVWIPHHLVVAGFVGALLILLTVIAQIMARTFATNMSDDAHDTDNPNRRTRLVGCGICSIICISFSLLLFLITWLIIGWTWVIRTWHHVQYKHADKKDYCHPVLYRFTLSFLLTTAILKIAFVSLACKQTLLRFVNAPKKARTSIG